MCWISNRAIQAYRFTAFTVLIIFLTETIYAQDAPIINIVKDNETAKIVLHWPSQVKTESKINGSELFFSFSRAIENDDLENVPTQLPSMIEDVQYGYDTLLLRLGSGVAPKVMMLKDGVRIELTKFPSNAADERNQLDYLRAQALFSSGQLLEARKVLKALTAHSQANPESTELLAQTEDELGRGPVAMSVVDEFLKTNPDSASIRQQRHYLHSTYGDQLRIDNQWLNTEKAETQLITQLSGRTNFKPGYSLSGLVENRKVEIDELQRIDGDVTGFDASRQRLQFQLRKDWKRPQTTELMLFAKSGKRNLGAGIRHTFEYDSGQSTMSLILNEPYWDLVEGIADGGSQNKFALDFVTQRIPHLYTTLGISANSYGIGSDADVAHGFEYTAELQYSLRENAPFVSADYSLTGRHISEIDKKINNDGDLYNPLPIVSVEIHYLGLSVSDQLLESRLHYSVSGGYALDRLGGSGPSADISLDYETSDSVEIGLQSSAYPLLERGQTDFQFSIGGHLTTRF